LNSIFPIFTEQSPDENGYGCAERARNDLIATDIGMGQEMLQLTATKSYGGKYVIWAAITGGPKNCRNELNSAIGGSIELSSAITSRVFASHPSPLSEGEGA
jgi:hypothetical protein